MKENDYFYSSDFAYTYITNEKISVNLTDEKIKHRLYIQKKILLDYEEHISESIRKNLFDNYVFMVPSGVFYFIVKEGRDIAIYQHVPQFLINRPFAFGYNEEQMERIGKLGLHPTKPEEDIAFIKTLRNEELMILKNFSYAFQNCSFKDSDLQRYFLTYDWYKPQADLYGKPAMLTNSKRSVLDIIKEVEASRKK